MDLRNTTADEPVRILTVRKEGKGEERKVKIITVKIMDWRQERKRMCVASTHRPLLTNWMTNDLGRVRGPIVWVLLQR